MPKGCFALKWNQLPNAGGRYRPFESIEQAQDSYREGYRGKLVFEGTNHRKATITDAGVTVLDLRFPGEVTSLGGYASGFSGQFYPALAGGAFGLAQKIFMLKARPEYKGRSEKETLKGRVEAEEVIKSKGASLSYLLCHLEKVETLSLKRGVKKVKLVYEQAETDLYGVVYTQESSYEKVSGLIWQLIDAVEQLHANNFVHRDIKPENILVSEDGELTLGDHESLAVAGDQVKLHGTRDFLPPSVIEGLLGLSSDLRILRAEKWHDIYSLLRAIEISIVGKEGCYPPVCSKYLERKRLFDRCCHVLDELKKNSTIPFDEIREKLTPFLCAREPRSR